MLAALGLSGCGTENLCGNPNVLKTVETLYAQKILGQLFGQHSEAPEGAFTAQEKSATSVSVDKQSNIARCSVLVRVDVIKMVRHTDEELAQLKENAAKNGAPTFDDFLVNYQVQPLASGQNYVTLLP